MHKKNFDLERFKARIDACSRKKIARLIGMGYYALGHRLNSFTSFQPGEIERIEDVLQKCESPQLENTESSRISATPCK